MLTGDTSRPRPPGAGSGLAILSLSGDAVAGPHASQGGCPLRSASTTTRGRCRPGVSSARRPDPPLLVLGNGGDRAADPSPGSADGSDLAARSAATEEAVAAVGLQSGDAGPGRHHERFQHRPRFRIDAPQLAPPSSQVPCQSWPSIQVTPVTKRLDS